LSREIKNQRIGRRRRNDKQMDGGWGTKLGRKYDKEENICAAFRMF
jgi:hypothetical protein